MNEVITNSLNPLFRQEIADCFTTLEDKLDFTNCLTCGMCTAGCPYSDIHEDMDPRKFIRKCLLGLKEEVLKDPFIWNCTMCGRCTMLCPMKVDIPGIVRTIRGNFGLKAPGFLQEVVENQVRTGNQMEVTREDYLDTLEWMEEELQAELADPGVKIPVDKEGADFLFLWDPREIKYYPLDVQSIAKIMHAAGANWTSSSEYWDATHYGLFSGDDEASTVLLERIAAQVQKLRVKYLVVTECGHATRAQRWGRKVWLQPGQGDYPVYNFVQLQAKWIKDGILKLDPRRNPDPVTFHDPCNMVRKEGIVEEPRYCVQKAVLDFREMWPNREYNYCCGGGGGLLALGPDIQPARIAKGKLKAEQIRNTGAKIVVTPCHNCYDQLNDIIKNYRLDVKLSHVHHLVSKALVL
ncbi:MAG: (Fe-S)-binding protein [Peptococcaceae bacterium]